MVLSLFEQFTQVAIPVRFFVPSPSQRLRNYSFCTVGIECLHIRRANSRQVFNLPLSRAYIAEEGKEQAYPRPSNIVPSLKKKEEGECSSISWVWQAERGWLDTQQGCHLTLTQKTNFNTFGSIRLLFVLSSKIIIRIFWLLSNKISQICNSFCFEFNCL